MKKVKLLLIGFISILTYVLIFHSKNNLTLVVRSDYPVDSLNVVLGIDGKNESFIVSIESLYNPIAFNKNLWFGTYDYNIQIESKDIQHSGKVFLFEDKIIDLYLLDGYEYVNNDGHTIQIVDEIVFE